MKSKGKGVKRHVYLELVSVAYLAAGPISNMIGQLKNCLLIAVYGPRVKKRVNPLRKQNSIMYPYFLEAIQSLHLSRTQFHTADLVTRTRKNWSFIRERIVLPLCILLQKTIEELRPVEGYGLLH